MASPTGSSHFTGPVVDVDLENECPIIGVGDAQDTTLTEALDFARVSAEGYLMKKLRTFPPSHLFLSPA